ncbi:MAG: Fic family protein [Desulfovibrio sp.]|nr:Fic family protein [Desulfovibrio sp.]
MDTVKHLRNSSKIFLAQSAFLLEGIHLDAIDTSDLINSENKKVFEVDEEDSIVLRNVINALDFLESIDYNKISINLDLYIKLNAILANEQALFVGKLRDIPTTIGCIKEQIGVYKEDEIVKEIDNLNNINKDNFKKIIPEVFCKLSRMQPFFDGNKRSTNFLCNVALIKNDIGIFFIDFQSLNEFNLKLKDYYQNKNKDIFNFIANNLIKSNEELASLNIFKTKKKEISSDIELLAKEVIDNNWEIITDYINKVSSNKEFTYSLLIDIEGFRLITNINITSKGLSKNSKIIHGGYKEFSKQDTFYSIEKNLKSLLDNLHRCNENK